MSDTAQNGKGSADSRSPDFKKRRTNYDQIQWASNAKKMEDDRKKGRKQ